jgi:tripartite-type tricarboxylate transporter receptor subunit TctC
LRIFTETGTITATINLLWGDIMIIHRRKLLRLAGATAALPMISRIARADNYPSRTVKIMVGYSAGGGVDISARLFGQWLSERLRQQFIVENRTGAATNIATEAVVRSPPDGYTLLLVNAANAINATYYEHLNFNFLRDIAPVAGIGRFPYFMAVNPKFPARNVAEFVAYAKANPGKVNMGMAGAGGPDHASGELLQLLTGIKMTNVPYRGTAPAITDLISGQVDMVFCTVPAAIQYVQSGKLRALAVTGATRYAKMPDVPTVGETVKGFESAQWYGVGAPAGTPAPIINVLNKEIRAGLADAKIKDRLDSLGGIPMTTSPAEFGKFLADETEKMAKVIKAAGVKAK